MNVLRCICGLNDIRAPRHSESRARAVKRSPGYRGLRVISTALLTTLVAGLGVYWGECGDNPAVFCYRIAWDLLEPMFDRGPAQ